MNLWDRLRGVVRQTAANTRWLETQEERLKRLETDLDVLRAETEAIKRYERQRLNRGGV